MLTRKLSINSLYCTLFYDFFKDILYFVEARTFSLRRLQQKSKTLLRGLISSCLDRCSTKCHSRLNAPSLFPLQLVICCMEKSSRKCDMKHSKNSISWLLELCWAHDLKMFKVTMYPPLKAPQAYVYSIKAEGCI